MKYFRKILICLISVLIVLPFGLLSANAFDYREVVKDSHASVDFNDDKVTAGIDTTQRKSTEYTGYTQYTNPGEQNVHIRATQQTTYNATLPAILIVDGAFRPTSTNDFSYELSVEGNLAGDVQVLLEPDSSFELSTVGKDNITASITQEKTKFTYEDGVRIGTPVKASGSGAVSNMTAGLWYGSWNYNIRLLPIYEMDDFEWLDDDYSAGIVTAISDSGTEKLESYGIMIFPEAGTVEGYEGVKAFDTQDSNLFEKVQRDDSEIFIPATVTRLGIDASEYFADEDFQSVIDFNTPEALSVLGTATSDIAKMGLSEIGKTVFSLKKQNRTFAQKKQTEYTKAETENERSVNDDTDEIHNSERNKTSQSDSPARQGDTFWSVRRNAQEVSQGTSQAVLHEPEDAMQTRQSFERDTDEGERDGKPPDETDGETRGIDRSTQSTRYDDVGERDEQSQEPRAGNRDDGSDLSEISDELPPLIDEELILGILANKDNDLVQDKEAIVTFFKANTDSERRAEFLKSIYPIRYTELDINNQRVGYSPTADGLLMWEGNYLSRTKESVFSWGLVAELIGNLIEKGTYFKEEQSPQINLFDFADSIPMEQSFDEPEQTSLLFDFTLPQQIIDEALCIGANDQNSKLDIVMVLRRKHDLAYNAAFLRNHYGTNGAGFFFNGEQIAVWYDKDGFNVARGKSAQKSSATHLSWEDVAKRITELLELGRYLPQYQLDKVDDRELTFIAERITMFYRDMTESDRERCFPSLIDPLKDKYGYPDRYEVVKSLLSNPDSFEDISNDYFEFMDNRKKGTIEGHLQYAFHYSPEYVNELMLEMSRPKTDYIAEPGYNPQTEYFISDDEINRLLITKSIVSESKYRIYAFFSENKDLQQRAQMVKNEYGISGYSSGNDNGNFDGKGFYFSHGSIMEPYAKVLLKWTDIAKRIDSLIKADKYITREEWERIPEIEKEHIAATLNRFFGNLPEEYAKPYPADAKPYELENSIIRQPEHALKLFVRFALAKGVVTYGMQLMLALFNIVQGVISNIMTSSGLSTTSKTTLPNNMITAIEGCSFLESIPLWAVTLIGGLVITVLSFILIFTVYGRFFKLYMYTALAPIPLSTFAGEPTQNVGKSFLKSYCGVLLEGAVIILACVIFSLYANTPPHVSAALAPVTMVWKYIGELAFNMLVLVGTVKMSDKVIHEMLGF